MPSSECTYKTRDNEEFTGYLAQPDSDEQAPGLLIITAIFGNDDEMLKLADAWAADGYVVSMPDIFWRTVPGPTSDMKKAFARYESFDPVQGMLDIEDLINDLKARPQCNGKVAVLGFCFGGRFAHLSAARFGVDAAACYHGTMIGEHLDEVGNINCPISYHFGSVDPVVSMEEVDSIKSAFSSHDDIEITIHDGASHNFSQPGKDGYDPEAAKASRDAVLRCFNSM